MLRKAPTHNLTALRSIALDLPGEPNGFRDHAFVVAGFDLVTWLAQELQIRRLRLAAQSQRDDVIGIEDHQEHRAPGAHAVLLVAKGINVLQSERSPRFNLNGLIRRGDDLAHIFPAALKVDCSVRQQSSFADAAA